MIWIKKTVEPLLAVPKIFDPHLASTIAIPYKAVDHVLFQISVIDRRYTLINPFLRKPPGINIIKKLL
jgi:hypothetical protein